VPGTSVTALLPVLLLTVGTSADTDAKTARVYIEEKTNPKVSAECLRVLVDTFKTELGKGAGLRFATSRVAADIVVSVAECAGRSKSNVAGTVEMSTSVGGTRGYHSGLSLQSARQDAPSEESQARITLIVDHDGALEEFKSGLVNGSSRDAASIVVQSLIAWAQTLEGASPAERR
jgi:hypothetical protein